MVQSILPARGYLQQVTYNREQNQYSISRFKTVLTKMVDSWYTAMGKGEFVGTVALDLRRAFDLVNHEILLRKLSLYKCDISSMKWFKSYLINRKQCVQINEYKSELNKILCGVPKDQFWGPFFLFCL